jgi:HTH-type transcriptional regulator / antitoxin HigA
MAKVNVEIELLKTEAAYRRALKKLSWYFDHPPTNHPAAEAEFQLLLLLVERYEQEHFPVPAPDPIAAIQFELEQRGISVGELSKIVGSRQRAAEVLERKRPLTLAQIRSLRRALDIPAEILIQEYDLAA